MPKEQEYSISELAGIAGVTPRTVRYYVSIGLLPAPGQTGPKTKYSDIHLQRLRLIRKLQGEHLPLGEIAARLDGLDDEAIEVALEVDGQRTATDSALDYIRRIKEGAEPPAQMELMDRSAEPEPRVLMRRIEASSAPEPQQELRTRWERVPLSNNVELHIRRPSSRQDNKRIERLIRIGREMLEEGE